MCLEALHAMMQPTSKGSAMGAENSLKVAGKYNVLKW